MPKSFFIQHLIQQKIQFNKIAMICPLPINYCAVFFISHGQIERSQSKSFYKQSIRFTCDIRFLNQLKCVLLLQLRGIMPKERKMCMCELYHGVIFITPIFSILSANFSSSFITTDLSVLSTTVNERCPGESGTVLKNEASGVMASIA